MTLRTWVRTLFARRPRSARKAPARRLTLEALGALVARAGDGRSPGASARARLHQQIRDAVFALDAV
jgi:hypothetical protein